MTDTVVIEGEVSLITEADGEVHLLAEVEGEAGLEIRVSALQDKSVSFTPSGTAQAQTVEADTGYDALASVEIQVGAMPPGSVEVPATEITAAPTISVDADGLITASVNASEQVAPVVREGYVSSGTAGSISVTGTAEMQLATKGAASYTPSKSGAQTIDPGAFLTGTQTIEAIPDRYYDMSGEMAWLGKGAELVNGNVYSKSDTLKNTGFNGWTPSTTAKTIVSAVNATTFVCDLSQYEYYLVWECGVTPAYTGSPTLKAHTLLNRCYLVQEIIKRPSNWANIQADSWNGNACVTLFTPNFLRYYGTTTGSVTYSWGASYGFYFAATAATFANATNDSTTVTIKTPTLATRCSTTYFSTGNAALVDQENSEWFIRGKLYRIKKDGIVRSIYEHVVDLINE